MKRGMTIEQRWRNGGTARNRGTCVMLVKLLAGKVAKRM
jgi:hypothetical protein